MINDYSPLVSIIIPVFNTESFLKRCLDSVISQSYKNIEIILVDDGSPDHCGEICDEYANSHSNVKVIHQMNGGLSAARNSGIEEAKGKFVQFVDPDDYLEPNVLKLLVEKMEKMAKMENLVLLCGFTIDRRIRLQIL